MSILPKAVQQLILTLYSDGTHCYLSDTLHNYISLFGIVDSYHISLKNGKGLQIMAEQDC
jgi:hypothetical protein